MPATVSPELARSESKRKAVILVKIIWSVLIILTLTFVISGIMQPQFITRYAITLGLIATASAVTLVMIRNGQIRWAAIIYISFLLIRILVAAWTGGGIKGHGIKLLPIIVLFAGLTLGKKEVWIFGMIATVGSFGLMLAQEFSWITVTEPLGQTPLIYWLYTVTSIFLLCYLENLSVEELRKSLFKCKTELELRTESEEMLRIKNEKLTEIAFLQSHIVRRPIASVLGLINVMNLKDPSDPENAKVLSMLEIAAKELDSVVHDIVKNTHEIELLAKDSRKDPVLSAQEVANP